MYRAESEAVATAANVIELDQLDRSKILHIDLGSQETKQRIREMSAEWATREPFYVPRDGHVFVLCGRQRDCLEVYQDRTRFSNAVPKEPGFEMFDKFMGIRVLAQMDGEPHDRVRRLMTNALAPRAVNRLEGPIRDAFDRRLDVIEAGGPGFDAMSDYGEHLIADALLTVMLKLSDAQKAVFLEMHRVIPLVTYTEAGHSYPEVCQSAFAEARRVIDEIIVERRANLGDDLISELIAAREGTDKLSDSEMFDQIFTLTAGALSGTTLGAGNMLYSLYVNREAIDAIKQDLKMVDQVIAEAQRWHSGGYMTFPRFAQCDTEVGGTKILKGMVVRVSAQAAHLDPDIYPDPLKFDINRNPRTIAFGSGPHSCLGFFLAKLVLRLAVEQLVARFPDARLVDPAMKLEYGGSVGELKIKSLPMVTH
jgi:cytochrome P450